MFQPFRRRVALTVGPSSSCWSCGWGEDVFEGICSSGRCDLSKGERGIRFRVEEAEEVVKMGRRWTGGVLQIGLVVGGSQMQGAASEATLRRRGHQTLQGGLWT